MAIHDGARFRAGECDALDFLDAQFEDCTFDHVALQGRDLRRAKFVDCEIVTCDLAVANVTDCTFVRTRFRECRLSGINWSVARKLENVAFDACQLNDGSFLGLALEACEFVRCSAAGVSFRDANLTKAKFGETNLAKAEFANCDLRGADFRGALGYVIDPTQNRMTKAHFSLPEAAGLLKGLGILLD